MIVLGRWRVFSARIVRRNRNVPKWTRLLRGLYALGGEGGQRYLDTFQTATVVRKLSLRNEKMGRLAVARKWADMVRKLVWLRNSERRSLRASINLRRLAMKLLRRNSRRPALKKWRFLAERVLGIVRNDQSQHRADWGGAGARLGAIIAGKSSGKTSRQLEIVCRWGKLSRKLVKKHDGRAQMLAHANLARLARKLLLYRRMRAERRLRSLSMRLVAHDGVQRSRRARINLVRLARRLVQREGPSGGYVAKPPPEKWRNVHQELQKRKLDAVAARYNHRFNKMTLNLSISQRWELLTALLIIKSKQQKSKRYQFKWRQFTNKLLARANDD